MSGTALGAARAVADGMSAPPVTALVGSGFDPVALGVAVLLTLLGGGLLGVVLQHQVAKKKLPIDREALLATASSTTVQSVLDALQSTDRRLKQTDRRLRRVERKLTRLQRAYEALLSWALRLVEQWETVRQSERAPIIPVHAVLDLAMFDDDGEDEPDEETGPLDVQDRRAEGKDRPGR